MSTNLIAPEAPYRVFRMSLSGAGEDVGGALTFEAAAEFGRRVKANRPYARGGIAPVWVAFRNENSTFTIKHV
jgi:hypothetical protein